MKKIKLLDYLCKQGIKYLLNNKGEIKIINPLFEEDKYYNVEEYYNLFIDKYKNYEKMSWDFACNGCCLPKTDEDIYFENIYNGRYEVLLNFETYTKLDGVELVKINKKWVINKN